MTTDTTSSDTVQRLVRAALVLVTIAAIAGAVQAIGAPQAKEAWALYSPAPMSSPIDPDNDPPAISHLDGDATFYAAGSAPVALDRGQAATVTDPDSPRFDDGSLTVTIVSGGVPSEDVLALAAGDAIALSAGTSVGSIVSVLDTPIGTVAADGKNGASLVIDLGTFANPTAASLLVQATSYDNLDTLTPVTGTRTVRFTVDDGASGISAPVDAIVTVTGIEGMQWVYLPLVLNAHAAGR
jgi:hypothetical protein